VAFGAAANAGAQTRETRPAESLAEALTAACRQDEAQFARYLTADNAATFQKLDAGTRTALMERFVLLDRLGKPLLSSDPEGRTVIRCETSTLAAEIRFGSPRVRENVAFIPIEVGMAPTPGQPSTRPRKTEIGLVREGGGWKLLSIGLLLLDLSALAEQWKKPPETIDIGANEAAAMASLRQLARALETYRRGFGKFPESLAQLGPRSEPGVSADAAGLVESELAGGLRDGYVFRYRALPPRAAEGEPTFELAALPAEYGKTGKRSFFLDSSGVLRGGDKQGAVATLLDPRLETQ
jgi:hypothetical protein